MAATIKALIVWSWWGSGWWTVWFTYNSWWGGWEVLYNPTLSITPWAYSVVVGTGWAWGNNTNGTDWPDSTFNGLTGRWGKWATVFSGTVTKWWDSWNWSFTGWSSTTGGSGGAGDSANGWVSIWYAVGASGWNGTANSISGASVTYGWGGGGASSTTGGAGWTGWGGGGYWGAAGAGTNGTANSGWGGGGSVSTTGASWWSGIVIISYATNGSDGVSTSSTGGTITTSGWQTIHTFTANGTFTMVASSTANSAMFDFFL